MYIRPSQSGKTTALKQIAIDAHQKQIPFIYVSFRNQKDKEHNDNNYNNMRLNHNTHHNTNTKIVQKE